MRNLAEHIAARFSISQRGVTAIEYGLIASLIVVAIVGVVTFNAVAKSLKPVVRSVTRHDRQVGEQTADDKQVAFIWLVGAELLDDRLLCFHGNLRRIEVASRHTGESQLGVGAAHKALRPVEVRVFGALGLFNFVEKLGACASAGSHHIEGLISWLCTYRRQSKVRNHEGTNQERKDLPIHCGGSNEFWNTLRRH
jgi:Flp pilus assembly pilin Flp